MPRKIILADHLKAIENTADKESDASLGVVVKASNKQWELRWEEGQDKALTQIWRLKLLRLEDSAQQRHSQKGKGLPGSSAMGGER